MPESVIIINNLKLQIYFEQLDVSIFKLTVENFHIIYLFPLFTSVF